MGHSTSKNPETGCRPDQLFGLWAIEETAFRRMFEVVQAADLDKLRAESKAVAAELGARPLYTTNFDGIARIDVSGPMTKYSTSFQAMLGGTSSLRAREALRAAARDPEVLGIMVVIDSPGGTVAGTGDLAAEIRQANLRKPVYTYAEDLAGSAALWVLTQGRKAFGNATAEIGSLGAYMVVYDTSGQAAKQDVKVHVIRTAEFKGAGLPGTEVTPKQLAEWERRAVDQADVFVTEVGIGRGMTKEKAQALHTGQMWVAQKARENGLIDDVVSLEEAMRRLRSEAMEEKDLTTTRAALTAAEDKLKAEAEARTKAEGELTETRKQLEAMRTADRKQRFIGVVAGLKLPEAFGQVLDDIEAKAGEPVFNQVVTQLKALAEQVKTGALLEEKGAGAQGAPTGAFHKAAALAEGKVKGGQAKTLAAAMEQVWAENPDLWKQYEQERGRS